ncbi:hypothetical protein MSG28_004506 [Choristoneura fumiferana]|uniref:Uncharacterized protein n=1 Tax=Choristoneura fumiferana TaxID=7141 RepID=A0ACC0K664_CHOFU|nr:hypothetical protein MSG28_004506 [Choristoneura fumiferana]
MAFSLPVLTRCCFCCPLRIGALVIGYLSLFSSLMSLAGISTAIALVAKYVEQESQKPNPTHRPEDLAAGALRIYITYAIYLVVYLYYFAISLLVVIGVHRNKPHLMKYYVNTGLFLLAMAVALVVVTVVFLGVIASLPVLASSVILFYCILVVRSAYLEMEEQNRPKIYEMNTVLYSPQQAPLMA